MSFHHHGVMQTRGRTLATAGVIGFLAAALAVLWLVRVLGAQDELRRLAARNLGGVYLGHDSVVLQSGSNTCGAAALKMILESRGISVRLHDVEGRLNLAGTGASLGELRDAARHFGLPAEGWRLDFEHLYRVAYPVILFVGNRHFVVLDSAGAAEVLYIRDPAIGRVRISKRTLANIWGGETLVIGERKPRGN